MFERADGTIEFRRTPGREVMDMLGWPLGALGFLGFAVIAAQLSLPFALGMGFFGLMMALVSPAALRRGRKPILIVSPAGIETPESGPVPWSLVAEVRIEAERAMGEVAAHPRRLGIVPVAGGPRPDPFMRLAIAIIEGGGRVARLLGSPSRHAEHAPFSIGEWELQVPLERAIEAVERYVPVVDERARAARRAAIFTAATDAGPFTAVGLHEIDARLAPGEPSEQGKAGSPAPRRFVSSAQRPVLDVATFRRRPLAAEYGKLAQAIVSLVLLPLSLGAIATQAGVDPLSLPPVLIVVAGVAALFVGVRALVAFVRGINARRGLPATLIEVGPDGIRTPEGGPLAWDELVDVHVREARSEEDQGRELVFVPHDPLVMPAPHGPWSWRSSGDGRPLRTVVIRSADLDGDFGDFVELVASYCLVTRRRT